MHDYLNAYVDHFGFRDKIRQRTKITCATKVTNLPTVSWRLDAAYLDNGDAYTIECDKLIVATGMTSQPVSLPTGLNHLEGLPADTPAASVQLQGPRPV